MVRKASTNKKRTKKELEDYLHNKRVPLMISLLYTKIPKNILLDGLRKSTLTISDDDVDFSTLANSLEDNAQYNKIMNHMINLAMKNAVTDYYESILKYCIQTKQKPLFQEQTWHDYSKLIRNGLSHDYDWDFSQQNKMNFPVKYKQITINRDLHGTSLKENQMPLSTIWVLLEDMGNFVENNLN